MSTARQGPVLIVAPPGDTHALVVAARIETRGGEALLWDSGRLPSRDKLSLHIPQIGPAQATLESSALGAVDLNQLRSIWWRRPLPATIPSEAGGDFARSYCRGESEQLLNGVLSGLSAPIYNSPDAEVVASRKSLQLAVAREVGFDVPPTLVTSSPREAREFACSAPPNGIVFKPFRTPIGSACATQPLGTEQLERLNLLHHAPVIFQHLIPPNKDIRVAVVGKKTFAGECATDRLDWRTDMGLEWRHHQLPAALETSILKFMAKMGLYLGHLDFRLSQDGTYWFFEVNPSGQFLFLEVDDERLEISGALADLLSGTGKDVETPVATQRRALSSLT